MITLGSSSDPCSAAAARQILVTVRLPLPALNGACAGAVCAPGYFFGRATYVLAITMNFMRCLPVGQSYDRCGGRSSLVTGPAARARGQGSGPPRDG